MGRFAHFDPFAVPARVAAEPLLDPFRVIIPCGAKKVAQPTIAKHLYMGPYFHACLKYAQSITTNQHSILILSAKYGFIGLHEWVEPYDVTFRTAGGIGVPKLQQQAKQLGIDKVPCLVLGGREYIARAMAALPISYALSDEMDGGTTLGRQLKWLTNNVGLIPPGTQDALRAQPEKQKIGACK